MLSMLCVREVFDIDYCFNKIKLLLGIRMDECVSYPPSPLHSTASGKGELTVCQTS